MVAILSCCSFLENSYSTLVTFLIYIISGIGGNIFGLCINKFDPYAASAGASTCIFGVIGCWISFLIVNWKSLKVMLGDQARCMMCCLVIINIIFIWCISSIGSLGGGS